MATTVKLTDEAFQQFCDDVAYLNSHWKELRAAYPNCYVVVYQGQVVATGPNLKKVLKALDKQDIPSNVVALRFIADPPRKLIL